MKQLKFISMNLLSLSVRHKSVLMSVLLHVGIILVFFTTPLIKNISHPAIIHITFQNSPGLMAGSPSAAPPSHVQQPISVIRHKDPVRSDETVDAEKIVPVRVEESGLIRIPEKMMSENKPQINESAGVSVESSAGNIANIPSGIAVVDPVAEGQPRGNMLAEVSESRFGDRGAPSFIYQEIPVYPALARRLGKEGRVLLKLLIDTDGKLLNVEVIEAAGYGFTEASLVAVRKSIYAPGYRDGVKVATRALLPVRFRLQ